MTGWRSTDPALTHTFAGFLPTVGHPTAVAPRLVLLQSEQSFGILISLDSQTRTGDFSPHNNHAHDGRTQVVAPELARPAAFELSSLRLNFYTLQTLFRLFANPVKLGR